MITEGGLYIVESLNEIATLFYGQLTLFKTRPRKDALFCVTVFSFIELNTTKNVIYFYVRCF